jgi:hypothetical protein
VGERENGKARHKTKNLKGRRFSFFDRETGQRRRKQKNCEETPPFFNVSKKNKKSVYFGNKEHIILVFR